MGCKFFHFQADFGKKFRKIIGWLTHFGIWRPSQENPGSATVSYQDFSYNNLKECIMNLDLRDQVVLLMKKG